MGHYPMMVNLMQKQCLVVGGGQVAERKIRSLLGAGADVAVVAPACTPQIEEWAHAGRVRWLCRPFAKEDVTAETVLIIAATSDSAVNLSVHEACRPHQWINVVDRPDLCTFTVPAIVQRGDLQIAISTGGHNPGLAKKLRRQLEDWVGLEYGEYTRFLGDMRQRILHMDVGEREKRALLAELLDDRFLLWTKSGELERRDMEAERLLQNDDRRKE